MSDLNQLYAVMVPWNDFVTGEVTWMYVVERKDHPIYWKIETPRTFNSFDAASQFAKIYKTYKIVEYTEELDYEEKK